jgi:DNA modification methylase
MNLTDKDKEIIIKCIENEKPIPSLFKQKLFNDEDIEYTEATKDYKLIYKGKARKEDIIANTPTAPLQKIRSFNTDNAYDDDWNNMLIFGDNLLAIKAIYEDQQGTNLYKTKNKIRLIYIDPPFATKQDFMKDREKAYRDKVIGAKFIEFLRKRLILLREILADDGSIYVHLDQKKGHYIKSILDEVFGEHNFKGEIIWQRTTNTGSSKALAPKFSSDTDSIYYYVKNNENFIFNKQRKSYSQAYLARFKYNDNDGKGAYRWQYMSTYSDDKVELLKSKNEIRWLNKDKNPDYKQYLKDLQGVPVSNLWTDIFHINPMALESLNYPTQKPEELLQRIISTSSNLGDIVIDIFMGSGTTLATAEKLGRKWIGVDCGKLSVYTTQKRILNLSTKIGSPKKDESREYERIEDFEEHSKSNSRGLFMIYDKARTGDLNITDIFLENLAEFLTKNLSGSKEEEFSLVCQEDKYKVERLKYEDNFEKEEIKAGDRIIKVGRVKFLISFIKPKTKTEEPQPLKAKNFNLYHAGIYDNQLILQMDWVQYKPFVAQLFDVRLDEHKIHSFLADGYIGVYPVFIWDYPNQKNLLIDEDYVKTLHEVLNGRAGDKMYIIAPISSLGFMQDEIVYENTTYVFLKVPLSVLMALIYNGEPGALKQPTSEDKVNEIMDAVGFDFVSQPLVKVDYIRSRPEKKDLFNSNNTDFVIEIQEFKSNTLAYDPDDFENFETFSMVMIDTNYNDEYFNLSNVFWSDKVLNPDKTKAIIPIMEDEFKGEKMMIIFMDKYGNELKVIRTKNDFK